MNISAKIISVEDNDIVETSHYLLISAFFVSTRFEAVRTDVCGNFLTFPQRGDQNFNRAPISSFQYERIVTLFVTKQESYYENVVC